MGDDWIENGFLLCEDTFLVIGGGESSIEAIECRDLGLSGDLRNEVVVGTGGVGMGDDMMMSRLR